MWDGLKSLWTLTFVESVEREIRKHADKTEFILCEGKTNSAQFRCIHLLKLFLYSMLAPRFVYPPLNTQQRERRVEGNIAKFITIVALMGQFVIIIFRKWWKQLISSLVIVIGLTKLDKIKNVTCSGYKT